MRMNVQGYETFDLVSQISLQEEGLKNMHTYKVE
jgi:hypothetical protein